MDILDFIGSKDVREHNKNTRFFPTEQAVLIYKSENKSVEEKLTAWQELLDTYSEEEFQRLKNEPHKKLSKSNKQTLIDTMKSYKKALNNRYTATNVIFEVSIWSDHEPDNAERKYFSGYESAFTYLQAVKKEYLNDAERKNVSIQAQIRIKELNNTDEFKIEDTFYFNDDLRMYHILTEDTFPENELGIEAFFVYVPLPFQKGDLLKICNSEGTFYGVIDRDADEGYFHRAIRYGDSMDMNIYLDTFYQQKDKWVFGHYHADFLQAEKCPDKELPKEQRILFLLRDVYTGKMDIGTLLYLYSHYGEKAHEKLYRNTKRPNIDTLEAIEEVQTMKDDPSIGKSYTDVDEMLKEILDDTM